MCSHNFKIIWIYTEPNNHYWLRYLVLYFMFDIDILLISWISSTIIATQIYSNCNLCQKTPDLGLFDLALISTLPRSRINIIWDMFLNLVLLFRGVLLIHEIHEKRHKTRNNVLNTEIHTTYMTTRPLPYKIKKTQ